MPLRLLCVAPVRHSSPRHHHRSGGCNSLTADQLADIWPALGPGYLPIDADKGRKGLYGTDAIDVPPSCNFPAPVILGIWVPGQDLLRYPRQARAAAPRSVMMHMQRVHRMRMVLLVAAASLFLAPL